MESSQACGALRVQLAALRTAFPGWMFTVTPGHGPACFTAHRIHGTASITATAASARELRRVLLLAAHA
jgi:DNA-binding FrmR family transcriptional regulator